MSESVLGGRTDDNAGVAASAPTVRASLEGQQQPSAVSLALALASGMLSDEPTLPIADLLQLSLLGSTAAGAGFEVWGATGPVVVAETGRCDLPVVARRAVRIDEHTEIGHVRCHGESTAIDIRTSEDGQSDRSDLHLDTADRAELAASTLSSLIKDLLVDLPPWGARPDDPVGVFVTDGDARVISSTPSMHLILGHTPEALLGRSVLGLLHPDDREIALLAFKRTRSSGGRRLPREWRLLHANGEAVSVQIKSHNRIDDPSVGGVVYNVVATGARTLMDRVLSAHMRILEDAARGIPIDTVFDRIVRLLDDVVDGHALLFTAPDTDPSSVASGGTIELRVAPSLPDALRDRLRHPQAVSEQAPPWGRSTMRGESVVDERLGGPGFEGWRDELHTLGIRAAYAFPFRPEQRNRLGAVAVLSRRGGPPTDEEAHVLKVAAGLARLAIERDLSAADLLRRTTHDDLTSLPNRVLLTDLLDHMLHIRPADRTTAVLFVGIDRFTLVNESFGHDVGDRLLRAAGQRLVAAAPEGATVGRFGGDEFVVLLPHLAAPHDALNAADAFADALRAPFDLDGLDLRATVSMGVAFAQPNEIAEPTEPVSRPVGASLLRDADAAMVRAKGQGRDRVEIFDDVLRAQVHERLRTEQDLRAGLDADELVVFYQPEIDLLTGRPVGAEALVRWQHPTRGLLLPSEFIELAEETGLVVPLGEQVLAAAVAYAASVVGGTVPHQSHDPGQLDPGQLDGTPTAPPFTVWVNAAMRQLDPPSRAQRPLVHTIRELLDLHQLPAHHLGVEITERDLVRDIDDTITQLQELVDLGVRLAVDDFGTGYGSLTYLKRLPVHVVKIDRSFVSGLGVDAHDDAIVRAVIDLAHALGKEVVAEGVETDEQRTRLLAMGCRYAQGFLFARPLPRPG